MQGRAVAILVLLAPALAGCLQDADDGLAIDPGALLELIPLPEFPIEQDHDHTDVSLHLDSANLNRIGYHSGYGDGSPAEIPTGEGFSELFVRDSLVFLGRRPANDAELGRDGGFLIFDVKEPAQPKRVGEWQGLAAYDVESSEDNQYAFFVSQYLNRQQPASVPPRSVNDVPRGVFIVDIKDPSKPTTIGFYPVPTRGGHTLTYHKTDTLRELVLVQTYDFIPDPSLKAPGQVPNLGGNPVTQRVLITEFKRVPTPHLELLATYERPEPVTMGLNGGTFADIRPHDSSVQKHPKTGQLIAYVAYWDAGAVLLDITDPSKPRELSVLTDFSPSKLRDIHLVAPSPDLIRGRHITVTEPEIGPADETGQYTIFDTSDPRKPVRLGSWTLPGGLQNDVGLRFSPHNFDIDHGKLYVAHYHAGVWVIDISTTERLLEPQAVAYHQPTGARPHYKLDVPETWGVLYHRGYVFTSDMATGLHILQFAQDLGMEGEGGGHGHICPAPEAYC